jgi:hypothetical protein
MVFTLSLLLIIIAVSISMLTMSLFAVNQALDHNYNKAECTLQQKIS